MGVMGLSHREAAAVVDEPRDDVMPFPTRVGHSYESDPIICTSPKMQPVVERAMLASLGTAPVLILGETGTGKELLARAIHTNGPRRSRPFVPVNCAALPHDLVESELFGHRRGAFSGALADHPGLFVFAQRGTLLLDEIGELPEAAQAKLLRVLQMGEIRPVGGMENRTVDVRMIAATNRGLGALRAGALRQDLFYRLSVVVIEVPPLRERREDIPLLFEHFLARHRCHGAARLQLEREPLDLLRCYPFPGNVRELENLAQFLCTMLPARQHTVRTQDVEGWLEAQPSRHPLGEAPVRLSLNLGALEEWAIRTAIERADGNKSRAAAILGISRDTLHRKLRENKRRRSAVGSAETSSAAGTGDDH